MSYLNSTKYARKGDSTFVIAAARAFYVDWWCTRMEELGRLPGQCELTEAAPETQRWAFVLARDFVSDIEGQHDSTIDTVLSNWYAIWEGHSDVDREPSEELAGWYAAMGAMGHDVGLGDFGIEAKLPNVEAYP